MLLDCELKISLELKRARILAKNTKLAIFTQFQPSEKQEFGKHMFFFLFRLILKVNRDLEDKISCMNGAW